METQETELPPIDKSKLSPAEREKLRGAIQSLLEVARGVEETCAELEGARQSEDLQALLGATAFAVSNLEAVARIVEKQKAEISCLRAKLTARP